MSIETLALLFIVFNLVVALALWSIIRKDKP